MALIGLARCPSRSHSTSTTVKDRQSGTMLNRHDMSSCVWMTRTSQASSGEINAVSSSKMVATVGETGFSRPAPVPLQTLTDQASSSCVARGCPSSRRPRRRHAGRPESWAHALATRELGIRFISFIRLTNPPIARLTRKSLLWQPDHNSGA